jgi:carbamoyltransferase
LHFNNGRIVATGQVPSIESDFTATLTEWIQTNCRNRPEEYNEEEIIKLSARALADGKTIGWTNGQMEIGPRGLGGKSVIANPRSRSTRKLVNLNAKYIAKFHPFGPIVLREELVYWFEVVSDRP